MQSKAIRAFVLLLIALSSVPLAGSEIQLGFEQGIEGQQPANWFVPTQGWRAELTKEDAATGEVALKLLQSDTADVPFGNVMRRISAMAYGGMRVTLTAKIKVVGAGRGQMWFRVDRKGGQAGAFDNMNDRPIIEGDWQVARIEQNVDTDAEFINIGFMSTGGSATLYIDDVRLSATGEAVAAQQASPPRPFTPRGVENLVAAAKLMSYVRFFHPSDQAVGVSSWEHFTVDLIERCESAKNAEQLTIILEKSFEKIAPTVEIWAGTPEQAPPFLPAPDHTHLKRWKHFGAGSIAVMTSHSIYRSNAEKFETNKVDGEFEPLFVIKKLGGGVCCRIPIAVYADKHGTLPYAKEAHKWSSRKDLPRLTALNRSTRLAGIALAWGVFQHFYPYFDVVQTDWEAALPVALARAATDADEQTYHLTLNELVAKLHDGHGRVNRVNARPTSFLPVALTWAGKELVVAGKDKSIPEKVSIGDVMVSIDGKPIEACVDEQGRYISAATKGWKRYRICQELVMNYPTGSTVRFVFRKPAGEQYSIALDRVSQFPKDEVNTTRPGNGAELTEGIVYFDLDRAETAELEELLPKLVEAQGIIFDLRGYPGSAAYQLMEHLIDSPAQSARWIVPIVRYPDRERIEWHKAERWNLSPKKPRLKTKIAFLTDGRAISYAESIMGIVEHYKMGEIVGTTTAGTNGNVNPFMLPGGYMVFWTGMKVLKHDGRQHHGTGIQPTVPVEPTAKGIAERRDEVLEKALAVLMETIKNN